MKTYDAFIKTYGIVPESRGLTTKEHAILIAAREQMLKSSYALYYTDDTLENRIAIFQLLFYPRYKDWLRFECEIMDRIRERELAQGKEGCFQPILRALTCLWELYYGSPPTRVQVQISQMIAEHCSAVARGLTHAQQKRSLAQRANDPLTLAMRRFKMISNPSHDKPT
jgi:hypothetical protein